MELKGFCCGNVGQISKFLTYLHKIILNVEIIFGDFQVHKIFNFACTHSVRPGVFIFQPSVPLLEQ